MPPTQTQAVKFLKGSDDTLEILAIPFGGPLGGRDTDGEFFSERTDLCADWYPVTRPLLYHHGLDAQTGVEVIGRVDSTSARKDVDGWWVNAQLEKRSRYFDSIKELIERDSLSASSGAYPHLTQRTKDGEIVRWPWVELSLTPTPANTYARVAASVSPSEAKAHYKAAGITPPPTIDADDTLAYADHLDRVTDQVDELLARTLRVTEGRAKVGRPQMSAARRERLADLIAQMQGLLTETEPKPTEREPEPEPPAAAAEPPAQDDSTSKAAGHAPDEVLAIFEQFQKDGAYYGAVLPLHKRT